MAYARLPVLTFHALDERDSVISFPADLFHAILSRLRDHGWQSIGLDDAVAAIQSGRVPPRSFVITFDDGYQSVFTQAFPVLSKLGMSATVFLTTGEGRPTPGDSRLPPLNGLTMLSWGEVRTMHEQGITFGAHTLTHPDLTRLGEPQIERELRQSQAIISDALSTEVRTFAYPYGRYDGRSRALAARYFTCACSDRLDLANVKSDVYALERVDAYYLRGRWTSNLITSHWLPWYIHARNIPRTVRRRLARLISPGSARAIAH